ncbi:MAG: hypothetical protein KC944_15995, partial [Candidatus Omnitrophica bacterium]|nr:hypothetical protein [Candidatus Omnitrophota bacterium]
MDEGKKHEGGNSWITVWGNRTIVAGLLLILGFLALLQSPGNTAEHPGLVFSQSDLPQLQDRIKSDEHAELWVEILQEA